MKLKKLFFTGFFASSLLLSFAQKGDVEVVWGDQIPLLKKHYRIGFVGDLDQGFVQITQRPKKEINFALINKKLGYKESKLEALPKSKYAVFEHIIQVDNRAYALISDYDKGSQSEKLLVREIDIKAGGFKDEGEELITTTGKVTGTVIATGFYQFATTDKFKVVIPDEGDRILIYYRLKPKEKRDSKNYDKIVYHMFDRSWKPIWNKEVTMPRTEANMRMIGHRVVGDDIVLFARTKSGSTDPETKKVEFDGISAFSITENDKKVNEYPLEIEGQNLYEITLGEGDDGSILIAGYNRPSRKARTFTGYFTSVFNPSTFSLENVNTYTFNEELMTAFESERTKRKLEKSIAKGKEPGIPNLQMRNVIRNADGGWYVIGEQYYFYVVTTSNGKTTTTTYHYLFMDAIVSSIASDGTENWTIKVPKNQHFINTTFGAGIASFIYEGNVYIFNLDFTKNIKMQSGTPATYGGGYKDASFVCNKISPDGELERFAVYSLKDAGKIIVPEAIEEMSPGVLMSSGRRAPSWFGAGNGVNTAAMIYLK